MSSQFEEMIKEESGNICGKLSLYTAPPGKYPAFEGEAQLRTDSCDLSLSKLSEKVWLVLRTVLLVIMALLLSLIIRIF
ncbi:hypothetical protein REC12_02955 [Desulfosporosinus sp. PR]|uniref:hypothetical protein n=1 Tax=Candidatus Desulfosporosinus nitrosoreducens TaxID=3401928 RepID=UPI0027ECAFEA|nr:hypothetical protein [Desulfosporosinus sp. PR]MDQ7092545.1 hypothetical protein [Desulfosporosinus sp. PR]